MAEQLVLVENTPEWRIDDRTRRVGLKGVAEARKALRDSVERAERRKTGTRRPSAA